MKELPLTPKKSSIYRWLRRIYGSRWGTREAHLDKCRSSRKEKMIKPIIGLPNKRSYTATSAEAESSEGGVVGIWNTPIRIRIDSPTTTSSRTYRTIWRPFRCILQYIRTTVPSTTDVGYCMITFNILLFYTTHVSVVIYLFVALRDITIWRPRLRRNNQINNLATTTSKKQPN